MKVSLAAAGALLLAALIGVAPMTANADRERGFRAHPQQGHSQQGRPQQGHRVGPSHSWHGDIRAFPRHDFPRWRSGYWYHGSHGGRIGWWWVVGPSLWYYYPTPVYPYPDPYVPPVVADLNMPPPPQYWYFCDSAKTYYPYVQSCPEGWKTVPVTPEDVPEE